MSRGWTWYWETFEVDNRWFFCCCLYFGFDLVDDYIFIDHTEVIVIVAGAGVKCVGLVFVFDCVSDDLVGDVVGGFGAVFFDDDFFNDVVVAVVGLVDVGVIVTFGNAVFGIAFVGVGGAVFNNDGFIVGCVVDDNAVVFVVDVWVVDYDGFVVFVGSVVGILCSCSL